MEGAWNKNERKHARLKETQDLHGVLDQSAYFDRVEPFICEGIGADIVH